VANIIRFSCISKCGKRKIIYGFNPAKIGVYRKALLIPEVFLAFNLRTRVEEYKQVSSPILSEKLL
jgi:hypothetical protein